MSRVIVFVDAQNFYRGARRAFFDDAIDPYRFGQFQPWTLGELLSSRDAGRTLAEVRLYTGRPDAYLQPAAHRANVLQCQAWERAGSHVFTRQLRYPYGWPDNADGQRPQEKGSDVRMALDIALLAYKGQYDVGVVCSADTDLIPAIEEVLDGERETKVEVAGWRAGRFGQRLSIKSQNLWCHWLSRDDYERVRDDTDYAASR